MPNPVREVRVITQNSNDPGYVNRIMVATPTLGRVRIEWFSARYGQTVPPNWSMVQMVQFMNAMMPIQYLVADAQNIIAREALDKDIEWLLLWEDDVLPRPDLFMRLNEYMRDGTIPIVSGLYFTKSEPSEPMVYRGRGNSYYTKWKLGDKVWVDGVPTGMLLIHNSIIRALWDESPEYQVDSRTTTRRVFNTPNKQWFDITSGVYNNVTGTSDLEWCTRIIENGIFKKAGWPEFQKKKYPFLIDTNLFCQQIDMEGRRYPNI